MGTCVSAVLTSEGAAQGILELTDMSMLMFPPELALDMRYAWNLRYLNLAGNRCVCVFVCVCLSVCLPVYLPACLYTCPVRSSVVRLSVRLSACLSVWVLVCLSRPRAAGF